MPIKTIIKYFYPYSRRKKIEKDIIPGASKDMEHLNLPYTAGESMN